MTLRTAKNKVLKAKKIRDFAKEKGLPITGNYIANAYYNSLKKLSFEDALKFQEWYNNVDL